jgi:hypothetical protein
LAASLRSEANRRGTTMAWPEDRSAELYFPEFKKPENKRFWLGCYKGICASFGGGDTHVYSAQGGRLLVKSNTHLYCIDEK